MCVFLYLWATYKKAEAVQNSRNKARSVPLLVIKVRIGAHLPFSGLVSSMDQSQGHKPRVINMHDCIVGQSTVYNPDSSSNPGSKLCGLASDAAWFWTRHRRDKILETNLCIVDTKEFAQQIEPTVIEWQFKRHLSTTMHIDIYMYIYTCTYTYTYSHIINQSIVY